jgi:alpha-beta hydrolase superfamily lysophospholipase
MIPLVTFTLLMTAGAAAFAEEIITLKTRAGVTQSFLLSIPQQSPAAAAVLFTGGDGNIELRSENGAPDFRAGNFLVRSRELFVAGGIATAVVDAPSDEARGMNDQFRLADKHAVDITAVVAELKQRFPTVPVFLVGTSRGTISAAATGRTLANNVAGVVLTSTLFTAARAGPGLSGFDFATIKAPLLFVHNMDDTCRFSPYHNAKALADRFPLITVHGGDPPRSDACEAYSYHGYLGKERETVDAMVNWMLKKPYRANID